MAEKKEVSIDVIQKAKKSLFGLPEKAPASMQIDAALLELKPEIEAALQRGYSKDEILVLLEKQGVPVRPYHLKNLLATKRASAALVATVVEEITETATKA